jgi:multiple sugar transport system permease protein
LIGAFEDTPGELEDAALIDGCGMFTTFLRVSLPLTTPVMISASIIAFIFSWNNFLFSLIIAGPDTQPLPVAIFQFLSYSSIDWGGLAAAATLVTTPMMLITLLAQRYIVSGFTLGAVKG